MSAIGRAAALPPNKVEIKGSGGRAAARPIADMYEDHDAYFCVRNISDAA